MWSHLWCAVYVLYICMLVASIRMAVIPVTKGRFVFLAFLVAYWTRELAVHQAWVNALLYYWLSHYDHGLVWTIMLLVHVMCIVALLAMFGEGFCAYGEAREALALAGAPGGGIAAPVSDLPPVYSPYVWWHALVPYPITPSFVQVERNLQYSTPEELYNTPPQYAHYQQLDVYWDPHVQAPPGRGSWTRAPPPPPPAAVPVVQPPEGRDPRARWPRASTEPPPLKPVLLYVHGGGWRSGDKGRHGITLCSHLAQNGWVCFNANYAMHPTANKTEGLAFPAHLVDLKRALRWVRRFARDYGGDPEFICIAGGSAGGHLASLMALTGNRHTHLLQPGFEDVDTRVRACASYYGVTDLTNKDGLTGKAFYLFVKCFLMRVSIKDRRDLWELACPRSQLTADAPPMFLLHGDIDNLVSYASAESFASAYAEATGRPQDGVLMSMRGAVHAFDLLPSVRTVYACLAVERFFLREWMKG